MANNVTVLLPHNPEALAELTHKLDDINCRIRRCAQQIVGERGGRSLPIEDWFQAESELFDVPPVHVEEHPDGWDLSVNANGYEPHQLAVTILHYAIAVEGRLPGRKPLFRQFSFASPIDSDRVDVNLFGGTLHITAKKYVTSVAKFHSAAAGLVHQ